MSTLAQDQNTAPPKPLIKQVIRWLPFAMICLTFFTLAKLPTFQFKSAIQEKIAGFLRPMGIVLTAEETSFGFLLGLSYTLKNPTITLTKSRSTLKFDELTIKPRLLPIFTGKFGAQAILVKNKAEIEINGSGNGQSFDASLDFDNADLTQFGLFEVLSQAVNDPFDVMGGISRTKPQITLNGSAQFSGSFKEPNSIKGNTNIQFKKILFRNLKLPIFEIPKIELSEGVIKTNVSNGKVNLESVTLGKAGSKDDLIGQASGTIDIGRTPADSKFNLKTKFAISEELSKTFGPLLGAILGPAKQPDGMYAYTILGSVTRPVATPGN